MTDIEVIKKDGTVVEFDKKKIFDACKSAGATDEIAEKVTNLVVNDLHKIQSKTIREKTLKRLKELDKQVAENWLKFDIENTKYGPEKSIKL
jgi:transcriptional regulator NrdR family protein